jgi:aryl-alcohol dehydrogenase-like predicted oxidoreductase
MQTRKLGNTDLELTTMGLGTWAMGGPWQFGWGPQDNDEALAAILTALDRGINWIDLCQMHWPDPASGIEQAWEEMARRPSQVEETAGDRRLSKRDGAEIEKLLTEREKKLAQS